MPESLPLYFYTLWSINGALDRARLRRQMEEFRRFGLDGVVFHPRFYPGKPAYLSDEYLAILNDTILHAKALGMRFWIYDENGWPSGTADGQLYTRHPQDVCQRLDLVEKPVGNVLASFEKEGRTWHLAVQEVRGIDCFNPEATRHFLASTHERYRSGLSSAAFNYVEAFFTDEPESGISWAPEPTLGAVPWSRHMPEFLREKFGRDVTGDLRLLFTEGNGAAEFREAYWELVTDLFCRGFLDPYRVWCEQNGKLFVGHVKGEEHPLFQLPMVGSCQRAYRHFSIPGIDALERYPTNHFYPRQASSVARQFGTGRCMVEANGGAGWGSSPEDLQRYLVWLGKQGLTDFVLHLSQYRQDSPSLYDWPPSQPLHISWGEAYPEILKAVRREVGDAALAPRDTLVIAPYRGIMGAYEPQELFQTNIHDGSNYPMTAAGKINCRFIEFIEDLYSKGVAYDLTDERSYEESAVMTDGEVRLGLGRYRSVVVAPGAKLRVSVSGAVHNVTHAMTAGMSESSTASRKEELVWSKISMSENALLLEPFSTDKKWFMARFLAPKQLPTGARLRLVFADKVDELLINGKPLIVDEAQDGTMAAVSLDLLRAENQVSFRLDPSTCVPFAWLAGDFLVQSLAPYTLGKNSTICTEGPFTLAPWAPLPAKGELVQAGLPFARAPVMAEVSLSILASMSRLRFEFSSARPDALRIEDETGVLGWAWGPEWALDLRRPLFPGVHQLRILGVPNSYNYYGPHHHYLGDRHVVSPAQIRGERNFADPPDAPEKTHVTAWHFRPWALPSHVYLTPGNTFAR